jgi:Leucine-rich repeat (LRR) protein
LDSNQIEAFRNEDFVKNKQLSEIDLSNNDLRLIEADLSSVKDLKVLKLSRTGFNLASGLNINQFKDLEELDLSYNGLNYIPDSYFIKTRLNKLNLRSTGLRYLNFLRNLMYLSDLDLSDNDIELDNDALKDGVKSLRLENVKLRKLEAIGRSLMEKVDHLDVSFNELSFVRPLPTTDLSLEKAFVFKAEIQYLDLSYNKIVNIDRYLFRDKVNLKEIKLKSCFSQEIDWNLYYFNDILEKISLTSNYLVVFPIFCSSYSKSRICCLIDLNMEENKLTELKKKDLIYMKSLKFLNLNSNLISSIENKTFDQLINLEKLSLASNNVSQQTLNSNPLMFKYLFSLKELNLSRNSIESLSSNFVHNLNKLVVLDLSENRIRFISERALNKLFNLKSLYLNGNADDLKFESYLSFTGLVSIKNVYVSKVVLENSEFNKCFFKQLFSQNEMKSSKRVISGVQFYSSLNILTVESFVDCKLILSFARYNVLFNLKSDVDFDNYLLEGCESMGFEKFSGDEFKFKNC